MRRRWQYATASLPWRKLYGNDKKMSIDLETYSDVDIKKSGAYRYVESPEFEILLFAVSINGSPVMVYDMASRDVLPGNIIRGIGG